MGKRKERFRRTTTTVNPERMDPTIWGPIVTLEGERRKTLEGGNSGKDKKD